MGTQILDHLCLCFIWLMAWVLLIEKDAINLNFQTSYHVAPASHLNAVPVLREQEPHRLTGVKFVAQEKPQLDKFKEAARELEADEDEARWDERLKKVAKAKPKPEPEQP